jgi:transcriptional repressor NrdR
MRCPQCTCLEDKVVDSRLAKEGAGIRRRRECLNCGHRFTTYEEIIQAELKVIKARTNVREDFDREKIRSGVERACWKLPVSKEDIDNVVNKIVSEIQSEFDREITSREIGNRVMRALKDLDEVAYVRFASVYRKFKDIEQFIEEIKLLGFPKKDKFLNP